MFEAKFQLVISCIQAVQATKMSLNFSTWDVFSTTSYTYVSQTYKRRNFTALENDIKPSDIYLYR